MRHALQLQSLISLFLKIYLSIYLRNLGSRRCLIWQELCQNCYQPPNGNLVSKDFLDVINFQNMERNLSLIEKESDIFGLLFLGDGATISRMTLLNILVSGKSLPIAVLELVDYQVHLAGGGENN